MKKILGLLFLFYLITLPALSYAQSAASFHCNSVGVVLLPSGFWVQSNWFCPHGNFFFQRGFHPFPNGFPVNRFLGFHGSWVIPAYPPSQGESWDVFVERYLKEHLPSEKEETIITFSDGELVKSARSKNTYLYAGASLHYMPDTKTLSAIGAKRNLKVVSQKVLASLPVGESLPPLSDGSYIKGSDSQVYSLKGNRKKVLSKEELEDIKGVKTKEISDWLLELIPEEEKLK